VRIALGLEYEGSGFCGWQTQPSGCAIQDYLQAAIARVCGHPVSVTCAGRTDAGVHALIQVAHFDTQAKRPLSAWVRGVNTWLPERIAVLWARAVAENFHARNCAAERRYLYLLLNRPVRPALGQARVGWLHQPLDIGAMREAAVLLIGEHDFSAFRSAQCQARSPVRCLYEIDIRRHGELVVVELAANAFLHHMARNIIGSLIFVGIGKHQPEWLKQVLDGRDRTRAAPTFAAAGLYLAGIKYDPKWGLPDCGRMPLLIGFKK
jgi:tRNA pseudouridine38-40 synthase